MEYPRLVYKSASVHLLCENELERQVALRNGWFNSVPEALKGEHAPAPVDHSVTVYKEQAGKMESFKASNQEEADMFIQADGWHASTGEATAAAIKAEWPADAAAIDAIMGSMEREKKPVLFAYAARIGVTVAVEAKPAEVLAAIRKRLEAGA